MVKDPRPHKPGSPEPDEALDLLRALARSKPSRPSAPPRLPPGGGGEKLDALKALAEKLDLQLRSPAEAAPGNHPLAAPRDTPFGTPSSIPAPPSRARDPAMPRDRGTSMPRFGAYRIIFVVLSVAVLVVAAVGGVMRHRGAPAQRPVPGQASVPPTTPLPAPPAQVVPPTQVVPPVTDIPPQPAGANDLAAIIKNMSDCDAAAAQDPEALYFLILPLVAANPADQSWRGLALQTVGSDILLLSAKDALDGLRDKKLNLRSGRYTFAVLDTGSGATYAWTSATSVTRLSKAKVGAIKSLRLGFDFSAAQAGSQWSAEFKRDVGACYWVSVLVRQ